MYTRSTIRKERFTRSFTRPQRTPHSLSLPAGTPAKLGFFPKVAFSYGMQCIDTTLLVSPSPCPPPLPAYPARLPIHRLTPRGLLLRRSRNNTTREIAKTQKHRLEPRTRPTTSSKSSSYTAQPIEREKKKKTPKTWCPNLYNPWRALRRALQ